MKPRPIDGYPWRRTANESSGHGADHASAAVPGTVSLV
jgi:hypothetical protein